MRARAARQVIAPPSSLHFQRIPCAASILRLLCRKTLVGEGLRCSHAAPLEICYSLPHYCYKIILCMSVVRRDIGVQHTSVIRNGQFLGVSPRRNGATVSSGSLMQLLGEAKLQMFYNDGGKARLLTVQHRTCPSLSPAQ